MSHAPEPRPRLPEPQHCSDDALLRLNGYRIHARPRGRQAVWRAPGGRLVSEAEALAEVWLRGEAA